VDLGRRRIITGFDVSGHGEVTLVPGRGPEEEPVHGRAREARRFARGGIEQARDGVAELLDSAAPCMPVAGGGCRAREWVPRPGPEPLAPR
jgi:hypothetical protein